MIPALTSNPGWVRVHSYGLLKHPKLPHLRTHHNLPLESLRAWAIEFCLTFYPQFPEMRWAPRNYPINCWMIETGKGTNSSQTPIIRHMFYKCISNLQSNLEMFPFPFPFLGWSNKDPKKWGDLAKTYLINSRERTWREVCPIVFFFFFLSLQGWLPNELENLFIQNLLHSDYSR